MTLERRTSNNNSVLCCFRSKEQEVETKLDAFNVFKRLAAVGGLQDLGTSAVGTASNVALFLVEGGAFISLMERNIITR